jgi:thiol-disulfide isomerase/thioredoxin
VRGLIIFLGCLLLLAGGPLAGALAAGNSANLLLDVAKKPVSANNFKSTLLDGRKVQLSDYKGKYVFLNFWATWCIPCVEEMPAMERLAKIMEGRPFVVVAVNMMEPLTVVKKFVARLKLTYDIVMDESGDIAGNYAANNLPLTYIIDKQGRIIRRAVGARVWDNEDSIAFFDELLAK